MVALKVSDFKSVCGLELLRRRVRTPVPVLAPHGVVDACNSMFQALSSTLAACLTPAGVLCAGIAASGPRGLQQAAVKASGCGKWC